MVNRYDADGCQSAIGHYVSYEDYERLLAVSRSLLGLIGDDAVLSNDFVDEMFNLEIL